MRISSMHCCMLLLALLAPAGAHAAQPVLEYPLYRLPAAPAVDGNVEGDPAWAGEPEATGFFRLGGDYARAKQTQVRAAWTADAVYLAVRCEEPDIARIQPMGKDGGDLWTEDGVEIFVRPEGLTDFHQFIVNNGGARRGAGLADGRLDWQAAASRAADTYTLEIALPLALFGKRPAAGTVWQGNFCRNIFTTDSGGDKFTTWAPLRASFHEWERFARWQFRAEAPNPAEVAAVEIRLNGAYRDFLRGETEKMVRLAADYLPVLRRATAVPQFAAQAGDLIRAWETASRLKDLGPTAPAVELRRAVATGESLTERSQKTKYDYLFWELFNT